MKAFCLKAPTVRFVNLAIVFAGVFSREWFFNSRKSSFVHSRPRTLILPPPEPETLAVFRIKRAIHAPHVYLRLPRARRERPRGCRRASKERDELAPFHCAVPPVLRTKDSTALLHCGISIWPMSEVGHSRPMRSKPREHVCPLLPESGQTGPRLAKSA